MRRVLVLFAFLAVAASPRGGSGCGMDPQAYEPCAEKACGAPCTVCDPADRECVESSVVKVCDSTGACGMEPAPVCPPYDPCAGKACGDGCTLCAPGVPGCVEAQYAKACDTAGACVSAYGLTCDPCAGKAAGDSCSLCAPGTPHCTAMMCVTSCNGAGQCVCSGSGGHPR